MKIRPMLLVASVSVLIACASCSKQDTSTEAQLAPKPVSFKPEDSTKARTALVAWFECDECTDGELENIVHYGDAIVPSLSSTLVAGLAPSKREEAREKLIVAYQELSLYAEKRGKEDGPAMSQQQYVDIYLGNLESLYRVRSAVALERIGTPTARAALERGMKTAEMRPEVRHRIDVELGHRK